MSASPLLKSISMADGCLTSLPTLFASSHPFLSIPSKPIIKPLHISSSTPIPSLIFLNRRLPLSPFVAQASDWAQEGGHEVGQLGRLSEEENQLSDIPDASLSDWDGDIGAAVAEGEPEGEGEGEEEESYPEPPEEAKLFVGNLPFDMDSEKLAQLFDQAGIVEVAEVIYNRETEQSRGFGFVTMSTVEEAEKAVETFNRYDISGRLLTVNKAAPRGTRPERTRESMPSFRIYVGNLPWQVDDGRLEQVFSEHGKVVDARVVIDRETGRSRGFGFVTMASQIEVDDAIAALDGQSMDGRALRVNVAEERPRRGSF